MRSLFEDARHAVRLLGKSPLSTFTAVVTLALGVTACVGIFSSVEALLLRPLPYRDPGRVTFLLGWDVAHDSMEFSLSAADFVEWRHEVRSFEAVAAYRHRSLNLTGVQPPERLQGYAVTPGTFALLGVGAAHGRALQAADGRPGAPAVAVLSDALWRRRFAGDPTVVGRTLVLNDQPYTVVGVMPPAFAYPQFNFTGDLWIPLVLDPASLLADRGSAFSVVAVGRLRPGFAPAQADTELRAVYARLARQHPETDAGRGVRVVPMGELLARQVRPLLLVLLGAVGLLLLVACANVAHLLLARGVVREREMALRAALGASRGRLVRQLLTESLLLSLAGGGLGLLLGVWLVDLLRLGVPSFVVSVFPAAGRLEVDGTVALFGLGLSLGAGLLVGLLPAWRLSARGAALQVAPRSGGTTAGRRRAASLLVGLETALSLLLLVGAGLLLRSFDNLLGTDPGFVPRGVLAADLSLATARYPDAEARRTAFREIEERVAALPGIESVGLVNTLPFSTGNEGISFLVEGRPVPRPGEGPRADLRVASPGYLGTLEIPVVAGRGIERSDRAGRPPVVVVNRALVRSYFPDGAALGRRLRLGDSEDAPTWEVVGVVGDVRHRSLDGAPHPEIYVPLAQVPPTSLSLAVRTAGSTAVLVGPLRQAVAEIDPDLPLFHVRTLEESVLTSVFAQERAAQLVAAFAALALMLAGVGLYGVIAYAVGRRRREIGVRIALGARREWVVRRVVGEAMRVVAIGGVVGLVAALGATRLLGGFLYGVRPADPLSFGAATALVATVALVASWLPARRATRLDPVLVLRDE